MRASTATLPDRRTLGCINEAMRFAGFVGLLFWFVAGSRLSQAREGYVRDGGGAVHEGHVRFESNAVIVVSAARGVWVQIPMTNVAAVGLAPMPSGLVRGREAFAGASRDAGWRSTDIGWTAEAGQSEVQTGGLRIRTTGTNLLGREDSLHFVYRPVEGPGQWVGRVLETDGRLTGTKAGFVVRERLTSGGRQVVLLAGGAEGGEGGDGDAVFFGVREAPGDAVRMVAERPILLPRWIKLTRAGSQFSAFLSGDGRNWMLLGKANLSMPEEIFAGVGAVGGLGGGSGVAQLDHVWAGQVAGNEWFWPEVRLVGGSVQVGPIERVDDTSIQFAAGHGPAIATRAVANIRFRRISQKVARELNAGQPGVYLRSGEFVSGEIRGLRGGQIALSSIPLGLLHFDAGAEVMAMVFRKPGTGQRPLCRLTTADGSVWLAASMAVEGDWVVLKETTFGVRRVPLYEVVELRWGRTA